MILRSLFTAVLTFMALTAPNLISSMPVHTRPDFAFPAKVEKDASVRLEKALHVHNDSEMFRALMDLTLARSVVSPDTLRPSLQLIDSIVSKTETGVTISMLRLLQATMLKNAYQADRWKYDRRNTPLMPIPTDYTEWSGAQFRYMIDSLCRLALANPEPLKQTPITTMKDIVAQTSETSIVYPTMLDFIANRCISIRRDFLPEEYIPTNALTHTPAIHILETSRPYLAAIIDIFNILSDAHAKGSVPYVCNEAERINFLASRTYPSSYQEAQKIRTRMLQDLYLSCGNDASAPYALYELTLAIGSPNPDNREASQLMASQLRETIKRHPSFYAINCLKNTLNEIEQGGADITAPQSVVPGEEFEVRIAIRNLSSVKLTLYRVNLPAFSSDSYYRHKKGTASPTVITTKEIKCEGKIPFKTDTTLRFTLPSSGHYIIVPSVNAVPALSDRSYRVISATHFAIATMTFTERNAIVVDQFTGKPVENAGLTLLPAARNAALRMLASTDHDGLSLLPSDLHGYLFASKDGDSYAEPKYLYPVHTPDSGIGCTVTGFTDLPVYHPGDSVEWLAIAYTFTDKEKKAAEGIRLKAVMQDANGQSVDTMFASTDAFGRITGEFPIPGGGITGQYSILLSNDAPVTHAMSGRVWFKVSDYKLPTFSVEIPVVEQDTPAGGVTLRGRAMTYSGMAVAGGKVAVTIESLPRFGRFFSNGQSFYSLETITDQEGNFTIEITPDILSLSPDPKGVFAAQVDVTSPSQESRQATRIFALGKRYVISASVPSDIDISLPVDFHANLTDPEGKDIAATLSYSLTGPSGTVAEKGELYTSDHSIDLSRIPSGIYTLRIFYPEADTLTFENIALYRLSDPLPPRDVPLWVPKSSYSGNAAKIVYGTYAADTYLLATIWDDNGIVSRKWINNRPGIHTLDLKVEPGKEKIYVNLLATKAYRTTSADITLTNPSAIPGISIESSTFRDRLIPGSSESWTLTVRAKDGSPASAAIVLDVYNQALRQLAVSDWSLTTRSASKRFLHINPPEVGSSIYEGVQNPIKYLDCHSLQTPEFDTYGLILGPNKGFRMRSMLNVRGAGMAVTTKMEKKMAREDAVAEEAFDVVEQNDMAAPMMAGATASAMEETEEVYTDSGQATDEPISYRSGEIPLALFRPMMSTDADGRTTCTFTVPDANTTWCFNAIAFTRDMLSASFATEVTASKAIMVTPNPPRFVRTGDRVKIDAIVFNNSETSCTATSVIETFEPVTGNILSCDTMTGNIAPGASDVVSVWIDAPQASPSIGYRVRSSANGNSDGEQLVIPVLPSSSPVIESSPFYLAPDELTFETLLPAKEQDSKVTLTYCDNPLWYVVTALPGLRTPALDTAPEAAASLFSTYVATGILKSEPLLGEAIREWEKAIDKDSMLVSMLSRNPDLKNILLEATPWIADAQTDTERMVRLSLLFDKKEIKSATDKALSILRRLEQPEGGWRWSAGSDIWSEWATLSVLYSLGRLNSFGMLPENSELSAMALRAFRRIEAKETERLRKYPDSSVLEFTRLSALWPQFSLTSGGMKVKTAGINSILKQWKKMPVVDKAISAMILYKNSYQTVARNIMESVGEFSTYSPAKGMWWPSVSESYGYSMSLTTAATAARAYAMISPGSPETDRIRQWLIIQKEAMDWGNGPAATDVIAAVLATSSKWIIPAGTTSVTINGIPVASENSDRFTGDLRINLSDTPEGAELIIRHTQEDPAWGAIMNRSTRLMRDIEAAGCDEVTIQKRLYSADGTGWKETTNLAAGDKVKVELLIKTTRPMDYVTVTDERAACLEPVDQLPGTVFSEGVAFYRENRDSQTNLFIDHLPAGTYLLSYEMWVNNSGEFASGIATVQSQLAPALTAHSSGTTLTVD